MTQKPPPLGYASAFLTFHGVGFAGARLSVREDCAVESTENCIDQWSHCLIVDLLLSTTAPQEGIRHGHN